MGDPSDMGRAGVIAVARADHLEIVDKVAMADHDPFGCDVDRRCIAGRRDHRGRSRQTSVWGVRSIGQHPEARRRPASSRWQRAAPARHRRAKSARSGLAIRNDRRARIVAGIAAREHQRHRHDAGHQAREVGDDELQAGREQQQSAIARRQPGLQLLASVDDRAYRSR